jgi:hypothetical protein
MLAGAVAAVAVTAGLVQGANVLKEVLCRILGLPTLLVTLVGIRLPKKLRLRLVILRDQDGTPVASEQDLEAALAETRRVLESIARIRIIPAGGRLIVTLDEKAPAAALDSPCAEGSWQADFGGGGGYFRRHLARNAGGLVAGYGDPVTVFVVHDVLGKGGCSLGPLTSYATIDAGGLGGSHRVLAHELGHACGLPHSHAEGNLMLPKGPGEQLKRWQEAIFRSSRHVTYF